MDPDASILELLPSCCVVVAALFVIVVLILNGVRQPGPYFPWEEDDDQGFEE